MVTGAARFLGAATAARLSEMPGVERVVGVDTQLPEWRVPGVQFARLDLAGPAFGRLLAQTRADTVVHLSVSHEASDGQRRLSQKESNVLGSLRMLAAVQSQPSVTRVVLKSTGAVYGSSPRDPAYFTEQAPVGGPGAAGAIADAVEVEQFVRWVGERRSDLATCILRLAHVVGPQMRTEFMDYLTAPLVPVPFGFDPRLQVLHQEDAVGALCTAARGETTGDINVGGAGVVTLSAAIRRVGGVPVPLVPGFARLWNATPVLGVARVRSDDTRYLYWGRLLDTAAMREGLGFEPRYSSVEALDSLASRAARTDAGAGGTDEPEGIR